MSLQTTLLAVALSCMAPQEDSWAALRELTRWTGEAPISSEERSRTVERISGLLVSLVDELPEASPEELLLHVRESENLRLHGLVLDVTRELPPDPALAEAWMARSRALASTGDWEGAERLLRRTKDQPELEARLRGLYGILAYAHDRAGNPLRAAGHGRTHCLHLLENQTEALTATAALPQQAQRTLRQFERAGHPDEGAALLRELAGGLRSRLLEPAACETPEEARALRHLRLAALAQLEESVELRCEARLEWLGWLAEGMLTSSDPWWIDATLYAVGDSAQTLNLLRDPAPLIEWSERAAAELAGRSPDRVGPALETLSARAQNRLEHLEWMRRAPEQGGPCLVLLSRSPEALPVKTRRVLNSIRRDHPDLPTITRAPTEEDPPARFSPQWMVFDSHGALSQVFVGDGHRTEGLLGRELARASRALRPSD